MFCLFWLSKYVFIPASVYFYFKSDYVEYSSKCANAMDETWFLEQLEDPALNKTGQVHLLDCHEYDKLRKIMLSSGLSENVLSYLGLKALEINQRPFNEFTRQHQFRER